MLTGSARTTAPEVPANALARMVFPVDADGLVLGRDSSGRPVLLRMFDTVPRHVVFVGGWWAAQVLVCRCLAVGAMVAVETVDVPPSAADAPGVVADQGHKAGLRMRDYGGFGDPASEKNALLVECGQHWEQSSRDVAIETMLRFLRQTGMADDAYLARHGVRNAPAPQRFVEVTDAVTIESDRFRFEQAYTGLESIPAAGTVIAHDGAKPICTPYDDCVLIMPTKRLKPGQTAVRLGRYIAA